MIRGLYTAGLGMITQMNKMDVITNNLANVNTTGYKTDNVITKTFSEELMNKVESNIEGAKLNTINSIGNFSYGLSVDNINTNFAQGSLKNTNGDLDLAISGDGFFSINKMDNDNNQLETYTRDGSFSISSDGRLITKDGYEVVGQNGKIILPKGIISISNNGEIYVDGNYIDKIKLVDFQDKGELRKIGENLYTTTEFANVQDFKGDVKQGYLETSNVNSVKEMVEMINLNRIYEANQKIVTIQDTILGKAVSELAGK